MANDLTQIKKKKIGKTWHSNMEYQNINIMVADILFLMRLLNKALLCYYQPLTALKQ